MHACRGGRPTPAGPVPDPLQSRALETQRQLRPLHSFHPEKGATIDSVTATSQENIVDGCSLVKSFVFVQQDGRKQRSGRSLNEDSRDESADKKRGIFFSWSRNRSFGKGPKKKDIGDINLGETSF